jgi:hypothetical protein
VGGVGAGGGGAFSPAPSVHEVIDLMIKSQPPLLPCHGDFIDLTESTTSTPGSHHDKWKVIDLTRNDDDNDH